MERSGVVQILRSRSPRELIPTGEKGVTQLSAWTGLCRLVPVPILDDLLVNQTRKKIVRKVCQKQGWRPSRRTVRQLAIWEKRSLPGFVFYLLRSLILKPLKIIFRTIFFWLAVRDAGRTMVQTWLLAWTLSRLTPATLEAAPRTVSDSFRVTIRSVDRHLLDHFARKAWRKVKRTPNANQIQTSELAVREAILSEDAAFLEKFEHRFQQELKARLCP